MEEETGNVVGVGWGGGGLQTKQNKILRNLCPVGFGFGSMIKFSSSFL